MATTDVSLKSQSKEELRWPDDLTITITYLTSEVAHVCAPMYISKSTLMPGLASRARTVEVALFRTADSMADTLHLLGGLWLADLYRDELSSTWLGEVIQDSLVLRNWNLETLWLALPTERNSASELVMPGASPRKTPLLSCRSAVLADLAGKTTGSTIDLCPNALAHLMGECQLGHESCAKGLGSVTAKS